MAGPPAAVADDPVGAVLLEVSFFEALEMDASHLRRNLLPLSLLSKLGFGTMLDTLGGYGCHIFIRGNRTNTSYVTTRISNIYLV